jgi:hypothetical protein
MSFRSPYRRLTAALFMACIFLFVQKLSGVPPVSLQAPVQGGGLGSQAVPGKLVQDTAPLFQLPADTAIQEFAAASDLSSYALVYNRMKVKAHMEGKPKKLQNNATVVHDGAVVGTYPDVVPFSLRLSPDGSSVAFGVVQWKTWNLPVYWFVRDGDRFDGTGHYLEDVEFQGLAVPWFSPDGGRLAYMMAVKGKRRIMVNEDSVFVSQHARLENPWSPDGKHLAVISLKNGLERLVVDGASTAAARAIRIVKAPGTYVADEEAGATFFLDGSACLAGREIHRVAASPSGDRFAISMTDHDGVLKVLHLEAPCRTLETWEGEDWKEVEDLIISSDGRRVFFSARTQSGLADTPLPQHAAAACGGSIIFESVAMASEPARTAWITAHKGKHGLCLDGKPMGTWDRIETPLVFSKDGKSIAFYAWRKGCLHIEEAALPPL